MPIAQTRTSGPIPHGRVLVTGCAGFVGSHLVQSLLDQGTSVVGVDCFTGYYAREIKKANLRGFREHPGFELRRIDLSRAPLDGLLAGVDAVYHLAGQPGVRGSFGTGFAPYLRHNVEATQRLLEAAVNEPLDAFVYASSSSVYGDQPDAPTSEDAPTRPNSPYGMTKVAVEDLAGVYLRNHGVPVIGLRYFTVYGPRQRPDMSFSRFITQLLAGHPLTVYGDGRQTREFTFIDDVVRATILSAVRGEPGRVYNIGGGQTVALQAAFEIIAELLERAPTVLTLPPAPGDVRSTSADHTLARAQLGFTPEVSLRDGLQAQVRATLKQMPKSRRRARRWALEDS